jgi:hypothetical protein
VLVDEILHTSKLMFCRLFIMYLSRSYYELGSGSHCVDHGDFYVCHDATSNEDVICFVTSYDYEKNSKGAVTHDSTSRTIRPKDLVSRYFA